MNIELQEIFDRNKYFSLNEKNRNEIFLRFSAHYGSELVLVTKSVIIDDVYPDAEKWLRNRFSNSRQVYGEGFDRKSPFKQGDAAELVVDLWREWCQRALTIVSEFNLKT